MPIFLAGGSAAKGHDYTQVQSRPGAESELSFQETGGKIDFESIEEVESETNPLVSLRGSRNRGAEPGRSCAATEIAGCTAFGDSFAPFD